MPLAKELGPLLKLSGNEILKFLLYSGGKFWKGTKCLGKNTWKITCSVGRTSRSIIEYPINKFIREKRRQKQESETPEPEIPEISEGVYV